MHLKRSPVLSAVQWIFLFCFSMNCCALWCIWALNCSLAQKQTNLLSKRALSVACTNWAWMADVKAMCSRRFLEFVTSFQTVEPFHLCWHNIFQLFFFQLHFKKNPNSSVGVCVFLWTTKLVVDQHLWMPDVSWLDICQLLQAAETQST